MSVLLKYLMKAGLFFLLCSNTVATEPSSSASIIARPNNTAFLANVFAQQNECYTAWSHLVTDWEKNGGGFKQSLLSTRSQIATDRASIFAEIVRDVWSVQSGKWGSDAKFGSWPISDADTMSAIVKPNSAIIKKLDHYLPHGCGAFAELDPVIWDRVHVLVGGKVKAMHFSEMPVGIVWDSYSTPRWVLYWLFVRAEQDWGQFHLPASGNAKSVN